MISASNFKQKKTSCIYLHKMKYFQVLQMESRIQSQAERSQYNDLQSLLCSTLQRVLRKVEPADAPIISDSIMRALLQMFQSSVNNKTGGVQEDALMAVSTLVEVLGKWSIWILIYVFDSEWKLQVKYFQEVSFVVHFIKIFERKFYKTVLLCWISYRNFFFHFSFSSFIRCSHILDFFQIFFIRCWLKGTFSRWNPICIEHPFF